MTEQTITITVTGWRWAANKELLNAKRCSEKDSYEHLTKAMKYFNKCLESAPSV